MSGQWWRPVVVKVAVDKVDGDVRSLLFLSNGCQRLSFGSHRGHGGGVDQPGRAAQLAGDGSRPGAGTALGDKRMPRGSKAGRRRQTGARDFRLGPRRHRMGG